LAGQGQINLHISAVCVLTPTTALPLAVCGLPALRWPVEMRSSIIPGGGPRRSLFRPLQCEASTTSSTSTSDDSSSRASDIRPLFSSPAFLSVPSRPSPRLTEDLDRHDGQAQNAPFSAEMEVAKGAHRLDGD